MFGLEEGYTKENKLQALNSHPSNVSANKRLKAAITHRCCVLGPISGTSGLLRILLSLHELYLYFSYFGAAAATKKSLKYTKLIT